MSHYNIISTWKKKWLHFLNCKYLFAYLSKFSFVIYISSFFCFFCRELMFVPHHTEGHKSDRQWNKSAAFTETAGGEKKKEKIKKASFYKRTGCSVSLDLWRWDVTRFRSLHSTAVFGCDPRSRPIKKMRHGAADAVLSTGVPAAENGGSSPPPAVNHVSKRSNFISIINERLFFSSP